MEVRQKKKLTPTQKKLRRIWRMARPAAALVISILIVIFVTKFAVSYVLSNYFEPVDVNDATPIEVVVPASATASSIARILYNACGEEDGLIPSTAVFKVYVDFVGKANNMKAGTYILSKNMSLKQIVNIICEGNEARKTVTFTIPEGYAVTDIAQVLMDKGLLSDQSEFLSACTSGSAYTNFAFIADVVNQENNLRSYALEGYLFPDTYEVYADASADTILIKMLNRFNEIFTQEYVARMEELDMTMDQVVTLASLIEREAKAEGDFAKVSAVFYNRLKLGMRLQSCASLSYVLKVNKYTFTESELQTNSPYNTYLYAGLPAGAVSNPGKKAIEAALYPNQEFLNAGYLYFCNGNPTISSELVFSVTYEEHQANVQKYQQYWN